MEQLDRRKVVKALLQDRGELLVVAGLGSAAYDVAACGNEPTDFPLWGGMGGALMVGLGLALAQPTRKILVLTGDGEMLMGIGSLATVGMQQPKNLRLVVLDNEQYGETGRQETHTGQGVNLAAAAQACGISNAYTVTREEQLLNLHKEIHHHEGPVVAVVKIANTEVPRVLPPRQGAYLTNRMRIALLGEETAVS